ncbi:MAG: NAD-dependent epimerase/dehydratase family protein [Jatrophihabitantaceae bacterium]
MTNVVLITGVSRYLGARLAAHLALDPSVERIIGVDAVPPRPADLARLGRTEFMRADIRNPLIAKVIAQAQVDTVVHASVLAPRGGGGGRATAQDQHVTGTMQLLAACQKSESVRHVVVKSTTAVYGCGPSDPAVFTEQMQALGRARGGYAREAVEVEDYVRGFGRRRPDISVTVLRFANLIGPTIDTALTRYLAMPIVPTSLGFDPRLQLLHESDAVAVLRQATVTPVPGVVNVAGEGVVSLSQAVRRVGRLRLPVPAPAIALVGGAVRNAGVVEFSAEQASFLNFGRVVDTTRLRTQFGYLPRYTTAQALRSYADDRPATPRPGAFVVRRAERRLQQRTARMLAAAEPSEVS